MMFRLLPYTIAMLMVVFGPLDYYNNGKVAYSYGLMATTVYISVAFYMVFIYIDVIRYRMTIGIHKSAAILTGASAWIVAAVIQYFNPELLVSGIAVVLMIFFIYLSFENPKEHIDVETNMFNKRAFHLMLSEAIESKKSFYIVNVCVDDMKIINNNLGYVTGKKLIREMGQYIAQCTDTRVYHIQSDSMTLMLKCSGEDTVKYLQQLDERFREMWKCKDNNIYVKAHTDVIKCPKYASTSDEIYDTISYMSEENGHDHQFIHTINEQYLENKRRHDTVQDIVYRAINEDGFDIYYQPIFSVKDNGFVTAEALVRLKDRQTIGFISPEEFIPIAEKSGMIMKLGEIVFRKVCAFAQENDLKNMGIHYIEVNLSGIQCIDYFLPEQLHCIMQEYQIAPDFINLEITETAAVSSGEMLLRNMLKLRELGCSFSMDDFGTGYSNLSQMSDVNYDLIKIDKSLIWPCFGENSQNPIVILKNVVNMLLQMGVKIVAEGVETKEQLDYLTELGVDYMQGYYYSKPISESDYVMFLTTHNRS